MSKYTDSSGEFNVSDKSTTKYEDESYCNAEEGKTSYVADTSLINKPRPSEPINNKSHPVPVTMRMKKPKDNFFARNNASLLFNQGNSSFLKSNPEELPNQQYLVSNPDLTSEALVQNDDSNLSQGELDNAKASSIQSPQSLIRSTHPKDAKESEIEGRMAIK